MHIFVHHILLCHKVCQLLFLAHACVCGRIGHQLALVGQRRHLRGNWPVGLLVHIVGLQNTKFVLTEWLRLCTAMATRSGGHCIQTMLEGFPDNGLQCNPCLGRPQELIPLFKGPCIETSGEEQRDGIGYKLPVCVGAAAQEGCFFMRIPWCIEKWFQVCQQPNTDYRRPHCSSWARPE